MTLKTICDAIADEVGIDRLATVVGNTSPGAYTLLRLVNKVGTALMKAYPWQDLRTEQTFTALGQEVQTSILPSDFDRFVPETFWDRTGQYLVSGPVSPTEWNSLKARAYASTTNRKFILRGGSVSVIPAFSGGESLAFEYISQNWCQDSGGTGQTAFAADTDTGVLDEELITLAGIAAYLKSEGLPVAVALGDLDEYANRITGNDNASNPILVAADIFSGGRHFDGVPAVRVSLTDVLG